MSKVNGSIFTLLYRDIRYSVALAYKTTLTQQSGAAAVPPAVRTQLHTLPRKQEALLRSSVREFLYHTDSRGSDGDIVWI
jgi:hypothetical protein